MNRSKLVVIRELSGPARQVRNESRDGWRVFRSQGDGYEVAIPVYQVARIEAIARREKNEWHGLVVGSLYHDEAGTHAVVRDFVPNDWAERGRAYVRVSAAAEHEVRQLAVDLHPSLTALGIIHTHPGYSTNPSSTDRAEFWSDPWAVSIIVDGNTVPTIAVYRGPMGEQLVEVDAQSEVEGPKVNLASEALAPCQAMELPSKPAPQEVNGGHANWRAAAAVLVGAVALLIGAAAWFVAMMTQQLEALGRFAQSQYPPPTTLLSNHQPSSASSASKEPDAAPMCTLDDSR